MKNIFTSSAFIAALFVAVFSAMLYGSHNLEQQKQIALKYVAAYKADPVANAACPFKDDEYLQLMARCPGTYKMSSATFVVDEKHKLVNVIAR